LNILSEKKHENAIVELEIEIPVEKVELEYKAVFEKIRKNAKVDGFRKGKAPVQMIETKFREYADEEVAENLAKSTVFEAVKEKELMPVMEPKIHYDKVQRNEPFQYKAFLELMPEVQLGDYKGLKVDEAACEITDADVENEINITRERSASTEPLTDPESVVENGHLVKFQLKRIDNVEPGQVDSVEFREYSIVVGKSKDEFTLDKHMTGLKVNDEKEIKIDYPESYYIADLAGQKITYLIKISEISEVTLPELTDEFAQEAGYESVEDMKNKTRENLENFVKNRISTDVKNALIGKIIESSTFDIPESMVLNEMYTLFEKTQERVGYRAESIDQFAQVVGIDPEEFRNQLRNDAAKTIKNTLILSEISKKEEIKASEEKYKEALDRFSRSMNKEIAEIEKMIEESDSKTSIENDIRLESTMDFIYNNAEIKKLKAIPFEEFARKKMG
jgi:trigger factor